MQIIIHRGSHEIGGSCVSVISGDWRIILDIGMPLVNKDGSPFRFENGNASSGELIKDGVLPAIENLYDKSTLLQNTAVLITHSHMDHYGLSGFVHPDISVFASSGTKALIEISSVFLYKAPKQHEITEIPNNGLMKFGPFIIQSILVDHSAPDAQAFVIECNGKKLFYSGDLRAHGRKGVLFERMIENPPDDIDCMLLEGSTLGRGKSKYPNEVAVENEMLNILRSESNFVFLFCSSQNIDRLVSAYKAALKSGGIFVIDLYTAYILDKMRIISRNLPQYSWDNIRVKYWKHHADCIAKAGDEEFLFKANSSKIQIDELISLQGKTPVLIKANNLFEKIADKITDISKLHFVWSMWSGYLTGDDKVSKYIATHNVLFEQVHSSGHATTDDLIKIANSIKPKKLIPIHTFSPKEYYSKFDNVECLSDGEIINI